MCRTATMDCRAGGAAGLTMSMFPWNTCMVSLSWSLQVPGSSMDTLQSEHLHSVPLLHPVSLQVETTLIQ